MPQPNKTSAPEGQPYRRLNLVPTRICSNCIHPQRRSYAAWMCKAGDRETCTLTGDVSLVSKCHEKNADGECGSYEERDWEAEGKELRRKSRNEFLGGLSMVALTGLVILGVIASGAH